MNLLASGKALKMPVEDTKPVTYFLHLDQTIRVNELIGKEITLEWSGIIRCVACDKVTKKSFNQGFCYNCFISAPESAPCIIKPELCRAHLGEGRDLEWEEKHHNQKHVVYLSQTDVVKVGITRATNVHTRWIDQGTTAALILAETNNRYEAGVIEVALKGGYSDKTNWQKMLKNIKDEEIDLVEEKWKIEELLPADLREFITDSEEIAEFEYPVLGYPEKVTSLSFDKTPVIKERLIGIRAQYLIFEGGKVLNIRKHGGYMIAVYDGI